MPKPGRPRALDETKRREICALLTAGAGIRQAARYVGCSASTIHREAARSEEFREQMRRAEATAQLAPLQSMRQAAQTHWRAAAWMLERSDPDRFGRRHQKTLGPKEIRALARDLLAVFDQEIDHPILRERIAQRVQATIRYAMRHAWDTQRTGSQLRKAMEFFSDKDLANNNNNNAYRSLDEDPWGSLDFLSVGRKSLSDEATADGPLIATDHQPVLPL